MNDLTELVYSSLKDMMTSDCDQIKRLYDKGVSLEDAMRQVGTILPTYIISCITKIPLQKNEYILPVQFVVEGYIKVTANDPREAIISAINDRKSIVLDPLKTSTCLTDAKETPVHILEDESIIELYSATHKQGNFKSELMDNDVKQISTVSTSSSVDRELRQVAKYMAKDIMTQINSLPEDVRCEIKDFLNKYFDEKRKEKQASYMEVDDSIFNDLFDDGDKDKGDDDSPPPNDTNA